MLLLPIKWPRLTGAIGTGLQRRYIACASQCHMKPIPDEMFIHKVNLRWNLPDQMFIHNAHWWWNLPDQIVMHQANLWWNLPDQICRHKANLWWNLPDQIFIHKVNIYIYDIFAMYTRWNIHTNQMKVKNYTSWNIKTKPMILVAYTSRCRKLHLKLSTLPMCSDGWNRGVVHCTKVYGPCYFSPLSGWDSLVPLELACKGDI